MSPSMIEVSNPDRVVFPDLGVTKGQVVDYYARLAPRLLSHLVDRPLSIRRFPKGLSGPGFFQKNVPAHYPESMGRFVVPRSAEATKKHARRGRDAPPEVTVYPILRLAEHLPFVANQGAIELHAPTAKVTNLFRPDLVVIDLDPPEGAVALARRAARLVREEFLAMGLNSVPVATGSKGYHVVSAVLPAVEGDRMASTTQKCAAMLAAKYPDVLTIAFRTARRGGRVFLDWLRNNPGATVVAPYSLRARAEASVAVPLEWEELDSTEPSAFTLRDMDRLLDRPDPLAALADAPQDAAPFVAAVDEAFDRSGLTLETFDRFRS
jgi:bifunctional non-homologous end joining protein LigD